MISFIVPAYNAEKTIKKCLNSIVNQIDTTLEYEIIVVNDGSTDSTAEIVKNDYEKNRLDINIKLCTTENHGLSAARNYGFQESTGDYIIFVDSDDYIEKTLLSDIEQYIGQEIDLIKWKAFITYNEDGEYIDKDKEEAPSFIDPVTGEEGFNNLFGKDLLKVVTWNYAIKRKLVQTFPEGKYHEDFATTPLMILKAESMVAIDKHEYHYVQTNNSIMRDKAKEKRRLDDLISNFDMLIQETDSLDISKKTKENAKIYYTYSLLAPMNDLEGENRDYLLKEIKKRKVGQYLKVRGLKTLIKKILISIKY